MCKSFGFVKPQKTLFPFFFLPSALAEKTKHWMNKNGDSHWLSCLIPSRKASFPSFTINKTCAAGFLFVYTLYHIGEIPISCWATSFIKNQCWILTIPSNDNFSPFICWGGQLHWFLALNWLNIVIVTSFYSI